ncbi:MAG: DUF342 domain-containing protein [Oscillibacter sp.]|nr:DUF342 domain-containing protein [Oscillibacter sp.]
MKIKKPFLSRLLKKEPEAKAVAEPEVEEVKQHSPVQHEAEVRPKQHWLELPQEHAMYKLCSLYRQQTGLTVRPELVLEGPEDPCLPDKEGEAELRRLLMFVTSTANKRLKQAQPQKDTGEEQPALPDLDAQAEVFLARNNLTAWLLVYPPVGGGKPLDQAALKQALEKQQVRYGVDQALLDTLVREPGRCFKLFTAARGLAPESGTDGQVIERFPRIREHKPVEDEYEQVDYTNLGLIYNVEQGGEICRIILPTAGTPGRTVQDREIPAKDGRAAAVPKGQNTVISEDGQSLVATMSGHVEFSGQGFHIKPVMDIPGNVDFSVGNISFLGDVCIRGDVRSGFTVKATGSITIDGVVEACIIEAGQDLVVVKGVQGDSQAVLRAEGNIFAKYLENCCVYAKQNLETECIINCDVYCGGTVTAHSGHGKIIGGKVRAAQTVHAGIIGSRVGNRTDVVLGGQPCENFDYDLLVKEIQELEGTIERTERQPNSPDKSKRLTKMRGQLTLAQSRLAAAEKERELQPQEVDEPCGCSMKCRTVHSGTVLSIGNVIHHFDDTLSPCLARLVDGEIQLI